MVTFPTFMGMAHPMVEVDWPPMRRPLFGEMVLAVGLLLVVVVFVEPASPGPAGPGVSGLVG